MNAGPVAVLADERAAVGRASAALPLKSKGCYWLRVLPFLAREEQRAEQGFDVSQCQ